MTSLSFIACGAKFCLRAIQAIPRPAEEAFQTALAIAKEQGARSWGLRAASSLAKLYQSTARPAELTPSSRPPSRFRADARNARDR